jgi:hypothetical protein
LIETVTGHSLGISFDFGTLTFSLIGDNVNSGFKTGPLLTGVDTNVCASSWFFLSDSVGLKKIINHESINTPVHFQSKY